MVDGRGGAEAQPRQRRQMLWCCRDDCRESPVESPAPAELSISEECGAVQCESEDRVMDRVHCAPRGVVRPAPWRVQIYAWVRGLLYSCPTDVRPRLRRSFHMLKSLEDAAPDVFDLSFRRGRGYAIELKTQNSKERASRRRSRDLPSVSRDREALARAPRWSAPPVAFVPCLGRDLRVVFQVGIPIHISQRAVV